MRQAERMASEVIDHARASYRERAWAAAYAHFQAADDESPLTIDDLEQLAATAYLIGKDDESLELWGARTSRVPSARRRRARRPLRILARVRFVAPR